MSTALPLRFTCDHHAQIIVWRDVLVIVAYGPTTMESQNEIERTATALQDRVPAGIGFISIPLEHMGMPDEPVRREIRRVTSSIAPRMRGMVAVVEGSGLRVAAIRSLMMAFKMILQRHSPTHVTRDLRSALTWLLPRLDGGAARLDELDEVLLFIDQARAAGKRARREGRGDRG